MTMESVDTGPRIVAPILPNTCSLSRRVGGSGPGTHRQACRRADVTLAAKTQTNVPTRTWSQAHDSAIYPACSTGIDRIIPPPSSRPNYHVAWLAGRRDSLVRLGPRHVHGDEFRPGDPRPEGSCCDRELPGPALRDREVPLFPSEVRRPRRRCDHAHPQAPA